MGGLTAATLSDQAAEHRELGAAFAATRSRLGLVGLLLALAAVGWWSTADRMAGMDAGPGTDLGPLGWFLGVWVVMMAAMMFPSLARYLRNAWPGTAVLIDTDEPFPRLLRLREHLSPLHGGGGQRD
jgi:hypothetical protein